MKNRYKRTGFLHLVCMLILLTAGQSLAAQPVKDRVVAYADNIAITLSDLDKKYAETLKVRPDIKREEVLNTMINRALMLREAKKMRLEAPSEDDLLKEYIDLKVKAFIRVSDDEVKEFYDKHLPDFRGKEFEEVRDEIETYLIENELNQKLKVHISELREKACIGIHMERE